MCVFLSLGKVEEKKNGVIQAKWEEKEKQMFKILIEIHSWSSLSLGPINLKKKQFRRDNWEREEK